MNVPTVSDGYLQCEAPIIENMVTSHGHYHRGEGDEEKEDKKGDKKAEKKDPEIPLPTLKPEQMIGATGTCELEPAKNPVKGGNLVCRKAKDGNIMCMIMCDEGFRPWHGELIIYCRDGVFYNMKNPLEVQKNMKCKEAPCDIEKYGIACFNHPKNRNRREAEFTEALERSARDAEEVGGRHGPGVHAHGGGHLHGHGHTHGHSHGHWHTTDSRRCNVHCNEGYSIQGANMAVCNYHSGVWEMLPGKCVKDERDSDVGCVAPQVKFFS